MKHFLTVCLNPTVQKTIYIHKYDPGKVIRSNEHFLTASGKGVNVSRVLQQLGHRVMHLTHCGGSMGLVFLRLAGRDNINMTAALCSSETRLCTTVIDKTSDIVTELVEEPEPVESGIDEKIRKLYLKSIKKSHTVIISGSKAPGYSDDLFPWMTEKAKANGARVICDYRGKDLVNTLPFRPDIIKPNLDEFMELLRTFPDIDKGGFEKTLEFIAAEYQTVPVITDGPKQIVYYSGNSIYKIDPDKVKAVNTIGCGDSLAAGMAAALESGKDIHNAVPEGIRIAGLNAGTKLPGSILQ